MIKEPEELKQEADEYLENIKMYTSRWKKTLLIVGGTVFISYKIIKAISSRNHKKKAVLDNREQYAMVATKPSSPIVRMIKQQIAAFLIAIAKQKLSEALKKRNMLNGDKVV